MEMEVVAGDTEIEVRTGVAAVTEIAPEALVPPVIEPPLELEKTTLLKGRLRFPLG